MPILSVAIGPCRARCDRWTNKISERKLATILVADIVGYSRLTANDEDWTIRALGEFRKIVDNIIRTP